MFAQNVYKLPIAKVYNYTILYQQNKNTSIKIKADFTE